MAVAIVDGSGRAVLRGHVADISPGGMVILTSVRKALRMRGQVMVDLPALDDPGPRGSSRRRVLRKGRILGVDEIGQLVGLSIELLGPA